LNRIHLPTPCLDRYYGDIAATFTVKARFENVCQ
jgi:hypothetical protein